MVAVEGMLLARPDVSIPPLRAIHEHPTSACKASEIGSKDLSTFARDSTCYSACIFAGEEVDDQR